MSNKSMEDEDLKRVDDALRTLSEHFDTVHIFATRHESALMDGTIHISKGTGNWFARYGQIASFLAVEDQANRNKIPPPERQY